MSFFNIKKEIKTEELMLKDYDQIWTKFCFLDESGSLNNKTEPYFTLGILKMSQPYYLQNKILYERTKANFYNEWKAYENITLKLMAAVLAENEILILIADHIVTPRDIKFEVNVKKIFNNKNKRLAIAGVCRFDSKSNDLLQVTDLLIGAITYDLKLQAGLVSGDKHKIELVNYIKNNLGIINFVNGFKNRDFNIFVEKNNGMVLENNENSENEKGPSS